MADRTELPPTPGERTPSRSAASDRWAGLSQEQRSFIEARLRGASAIGDAESIGRRPDPGWAPLSFAQESLWFLHRLEAGSVAYNRSWGLRLTGPLDRRALETALNRIVARHEILRTSILEVDGSARQIINPAQPVPLPFLDLSKLEEAERQARIDRLAAEEARKPFDLAADLNIRAGLIRAGKSDHVLLLTAHRIAIDAWSAQVFANELSALYEADLARLPAPLHAPACQYGDFADWQRRRLQGAVMEGLTAFWKSQLAGELPILRLPSDQPRPAAPTHRASCLRTLLPASFRDTLTALARQEDATPYMVLMAAFYVLLYRYSEQEDILVGSPIAGRSHVQTEGMIGLFLNTLVLRTDLSGAPTFLELLGRVRKVALEALAHQDLPFERLVEELRPQRESGRTPLFQVLFNLENVPGRTPTTGTLAIEQIEFETGFSQFDLSMEIADRPEGLACSLRYRTDLHGDSAMRRMLGHYQILLEGIAENPSCRIAQLPLLSEAERHDLLTAWNDTRADYSDAMCIHQLVEAQTARTPRAPAVVTPHTQTTYEVLNQEANRLARYLRRRGAGPGVIVGVLAERSPGLVTGLLGILKSGGAYIALDPHYPPARLEFMLRDCGARLILTQENVLSQLPTFGGEVINLDRDRPHFADEDSANIDLRTSPDDLAYLVYTSGSTGVPKGVPIAHRGVVNYLTFLERSYPLTSSDVVLQLASPSFDMSVREYFGPLAAGAQLALVGGRETRDPASLLSRVEDLRVTAFLGVVPTMLNSLAAEAFRRSGDYSSVRLIMTGGETLSWESLEKARRAFPHASVIVNQYGPTEITMIATQYRAPSPPERGASATVPIGRPIANVKAYILDRYLQPVPIGVPGELLIGGVGLTRGYLDRPDLTAERFLPNPFGGDAGDRLYTTGDLARYLPDGNIEFLGRVDDQVKVRGYRVEPGEIEAVLGRHPSIHQAAVTATEEGEGSVRLIAFVVVRAGHDIRPPELREFLKERLPDYMVPSTITVLEALPLTPSGKVNRRALPGADHGRPELPAAFVAPSSSMEAYLAKIWCDLLGVDQVGVHDNFFDLGGHSLLAARVIARIRDALHVDVELRRFFDGEPTVARLASHIEAMIQEREKGMASGVPPMWSSLVPLQLGGALPPLFCVHWAGGHVVIYRDLARFLGPDQPVYGLQAVGLDGRQAPHTRLEDMAAHYIGEVRRLQPVGPYYLAGASMGGKIAFEMAQQLLDQGQEVGLLALIDSAGDVERRALPVGTRIQLHTANIRELGWPRGAGYLAQRTRVRLRRLIYGFVIGRGWPLPRFMRNLRTVSYIAARNYRLRDYPGKVTLFRAAQRPPGGTKEFFLGWDRVAGGGMQVCEIPGNHVSLLKEPGVRLLAQELQRCLSRPGAQGSDG